MACEYCYGDSMNKPIIYMPTVKVIVRVLNNDGKQPRLVFNESGDPYEVAYSGRINYCPMCGERLGYGHE